MRQKPAINSIFISRNINILVVLQETIIKTVATRKMVFKLLTISSKLAVQSILVYN